MKTFFEELEKGMLVVVVFCNDSDCELTTEEKIKKRDISLLERDFHNSELAIVERIDKVKNTATFRIFTQNYLPVNRSKNKIIILCNKEEQRIVYLKDIYYAFPCSEYIWDNFLKIINRCYEEVKKREQELSSGLDYLAKIAKIHFEH